MPPSIVLRPKLVWRVVAPAAAVGHAALAVTRFGWPYLLGLLALVCITAYAWRAVLVLQDGVLGVRGLWRWETVDLQDLRGVTLHWETWPGGLPRRVLSLRAHSGDYLEITLLVWSGWRPVLRAVATSPAGDVDVKTRRRLAAYA